MTETERISLLIERINNFDFIQLRAVSDVLELLELKGILQIGIY